MSQILYISYDGMLEPLGQSQVIAYLEPLSNEHRFSLISFEKEADWADKEHRKALDDRLAASGIEWIPLRYHKRPTLLATAFDIANGIRVARRTIAGKNFRLVHARSYVPALIATFAGPAKLLFDMRGLWAEERVEGGLWPRDGLLYRMVKRVERRLFRRAEGIVTLTHASVPVVERWRNAAGGSASVRVITTCTDLDRFRPPVIREPDRPFTLGYVGSLGTWYMVDEMLRMYAAVRLLRHDARLLMINRNEHLLVRERIAALGINSDEVELRPARPDEVPLQIQRMDAGMAFIRPSFSKIASAPTKLGEYLGCGIPCAVSDTGDTGDIVRRDGVGVVLTSFDDASLLVAARGLLEIAAHSDVRQRCRASAESNFALTGGVAAYRAFYQELLT